MKAFVAVEHGQVFEAAPTSAGRVAAALERFAFLVPVIVIGGGLFFLPDYFGRYREQEPVPGFFLAALLGGAALIGLFASTLRYLREERWVIDVGEGLLVYETNRLFSAQVEQAGIELDRVERFRLETASFPGATGLFVELDDGSITERIFETRLGGSSIVEVAAQLEAFIEGRRLDIPVDRDEK